MPRDKMTISLPAPLRRYIEGRTKYQYGSVSEYIRELVRQDEARMRAAEEASLEKRMRSASAWQPDDGRYGRSS